MGQGQSRDEGTSPAGGGPRKTDYYELLEVPVQATDIEIKKAYRKKALELHPDRNYGNTTDATALFAEVQTAYEILSNPHERAWYDSHRDEILRGGVGQAEDHYEGSVRVTTTEDITRMYMSFNGSLKFDDSPEGFYTVLCKLFEGLAWEEVLSCERDDDVPPAYPSFGASNDDYKDVVRPFYSAWSGFATRKSFAWKNMYRMSEAPNRETRRLMEKENRKAREQGIRDFNAAVRALVSFVKRRDPRAAPAPSGADLHETMRKEAARQAAKARAANQAAVEGYVAPTWAQTAEPEDKISDEESEPELEEIFECAICKKTFKSESQYEAHEKSKKHRKAVHDIERQMRKENKALGLDKVAKPPNPEITPVEDEDEGLSDSQATEVDQIEEDELALVSDKHLSSPGPSKADADEHEAGQSEDADDASSEQSQDDTLVDETEEASVHKADAAQDVSSETDLASRLDAQSLDDSEGPKKGKAKQKRAKKAARQEDAQASSEHQCNICRGDFQSRSKLFEHIKKTGHARAVPQTAGGGKKKRG